MALWHYLYLLNFFYWGQMYLMHFRYRLILCLRRTIHLYQSPVVLLNFTDHEVQVRSLPDFIFTLDHPTYPCNLILFLGLRHQYLPFNARTFHAIFLIFFSVESRLMIYEKPPSISVLFYGCFLYPFVLWQFQDTTIVVLYNVSCSRNCIERITGKLGVLSPIGSDEQHRLSLEFDPGL